MSDGNAAYKSKDYAVAVADFKKALEEKTGAEQAKVYYKLGLSYDKLGDTDKALQSYKAAQSVDPTLSFAKNPTAFERKLAHDAQPTAQASTSAKGSGDPVANALTTANVYIDPEIKEQIDQTTLEEVAVENERTTVKIVVLSGLPAWYRQFAQKHGYDSTSALTHYAAGLHKHLNLGRNGLEILCVNGYGAGIALASSDLKPEDETRLARQFTAKIQAGDLSQLVPLARDFVIAINGAHMTQQAIIWLIVIILGLVVSIVLIRRDQAKKARMAGVRAPVDALRQSVEEGIEYVDGYLPTLPKNNADTDQIRAYRQAAASRFEQAVKIVDRATEVSDLTRAQSLLDQAKQDADKARGCLDRITGGTADSSGNAPVQPSAPAILAPDVQSIPDEHRGVSFFSSRPAPVKELVPVTLHVDGVDRQVLATPPEAAQVKQGQIPAVRAFNVDGRSVPWYMYEGYDPYRDYWTYQNGGWSNVAAGAVAGFIGAELLDSLFSRPAYGGSWLSPYGYAPGWDNWSYWDSYDRGFFDGDQFQAHSYAFSDNYTNPMGQSDTGAGGVGMTGPGYDQSDYGASAQDAGGAGFFGGDSS